MSTTDDLAYPIVVHCRTLSLKKLRINLSFKQQLSTCSYSASVKSSCFFSRLACATLIFIGSPSWYLW